MLWDKSMESGITVIDYEHQELVAQLEKLTNATTPEQARKTLDFLQEYVVKHFAHEQVLHRRVQYPHADAHRQSHQDFIQRVQELDREYGESGNTAAALQKISAVLTDWLRNHILGEDKEFAEFYMERKRSSESAAFPFK